MIKATNRRGKYQIINRKKIIRRTRNFNSPLHRDLAAMIQVWKMLRRGTLRALSKIGRNY